MKRSLIIVLCLAAIAVGLGRRFVPSHSLIGPDTVLHFKLNSQIMATGYLFDYSLNDIRGTLFDGDDPITLIPAYPGFHFDGATDFIYTDTTHQSVFRGDFSMSVWVKPDDGRPAGTEYIAGCRNGAAEDEVTISLLATGKVRFNYESDNDVATADSTVVFANGQGSWTHIVVTAEEDTIMSVYIDSVNVQNTDPIGVTFADYTTDCNPNLGAFNADETLVGYGNWFAGIISDFRIIDKTLTAVEIKNIYETTRWRYQK